MARLRAFVSALILFLVFPRNVRGDNKSLVELTKLPSCGLDCFTATTPNTTCGPADLNCICTDSTFQTLASQCIQSKCTIREAFEIKKVEDEACDRPTRSRKGFLLIPLAAEIPAWACPWVHLYSRLTTSNKLEVDDWIIIVAGVLYSAFMVLGQYVGQRSFGVDIWTLDPDALTMSFKCIPIAYIWEGWEKPDYVGYCLSLNHLTFISTGFGIVQDLVILILPLPSIFKLNINIRDKIGLVFMFSLGLFATAISCLRTLYIIKFDRSNANPTWEYVDLMVWTGLEVAIAVIVVCLPAIWALLKRSVPWLAGSDRSGYIKTPSRTDVDSVGTRRPITKGDIRHLVMLHDSHDRKEDGAMAELAPPPSAAHVDYSPRHSPLRRYGSSPTLGSGILAMNRPKSIGTNTIGSGLSSYHENNHF